MRLAVFSDMHGNNVALEAALADMRTQAVDSTVCLGDAVQGGPQPAEVVSRLRELRCPVVMGNADAWLLTGKETGDEGLSDERRRIMQDVRAWTLAQLSPDDLTYIGAFLPAVELRLADGFTLLAYHGSPQSFDDVILPDIAQEKLAAYLVGRAADVYCGGHTHVQFVRRLGAGPQVHFNPGSAGVAYSHHQADEGFQADPWAEYAILDVADGHLAGLTFRRVPYEVRALLDAYTRSGRPHAAAAMAQHTGR
jgi:predicted phosphodiesterase